MSNLATRLDEPHLRLGADLVLGPWLPEESPLHMRRHALDEDAVVSPGLPDRPTTSPRNIVARRVAVFGATFALTFLVAIVPYVLYQRDGFDPLEMLGFGVFLMLATAISCWFCSAAAGLMVLLTGREQEDLAFAPHPAEPKLRTALLMPLYNEDAHAALSRLANIDASLARLGVSDAFDLFVLSDSRREEVVASEQAAFRSLRLQANSRAFYRRREMNTEHKAGNISEWVRRFGGAYENMIVLDADSTMAGETVLRLVDAMERNPGVGLIQTAPVITGASTLFARLQQFGVRMYGRVAAAGLAWWAGAEASYWGHNAVVRVKAFADCAGLPVLEGQKPFGGPVMSHDVVEAALLRRGGWAVHVTAALDGSCEETPPTMLDFIRRDHRWCQGNLQHLGLMRWKGMSPISRLQFSMGAMAYLSSPLWFAALVIGVAIQLQYPVDWASFWYFLHPQFTPFMLGSLMSGVLLIGPKIMGAMLVLNRPRERRAFGGGKAVMKSVAVEIVLAALVAPIMMVANTRSVMLTLSGRDAGWGGQQREADGVAWADAFKAMRWQMMTGAAFSVALGFRPDLAICFAPIVLPLLLAAPICVYGSRRSAGDAFAARGLMSIPADDGVAVTAAPVTRPSDLRRPVAALAR